MGPGEGLVLCIEGSDWSQPSHGRHDLGDHPLTYPGSTERHPDDPVTVVSQRICHRLAQQRVGPCLLVDQCADRDRSVGCLEQVRTERKQSRVFVGRDLSLEGDEQHPGVEGDLVDHPNRWGAPCQRDCAGSREQGFTPGKV